MRDKRVTLLSAAVDDAREKLALRAERPVDARFTFELPHVRAVVDDAHLEIESISRNDGPPELRFVDPEEVEKARRFVEGLARVREDAADLRERFDDEDAGHDRILREMTLEPGLVHAHALVAADLLVRDDVGHAIDEHERPAMREDLEDLLDVELGALRASLAHSI